MTPLLETKGLDVVIGGHRVCDQLVLSIHPGQCWALLGRNGTGKTTLLQHLAGLRQDHAGKIRCAGRDLNRCSARERAQRIGVLLQHSSRGFGPSVFDTILSGRHPHLPAFGWESDNDLKIADDCLTALGLEHLADRSLQTLSGGELRRVEIARLLAQQTPLSLLDEPTNHLDLAQQAGSLRCLRERCVSAKRAMVMVVHDLNIAYRMCDHWLILHGDGSWQAGMRESLANSACLSAAFAHPIARVAGRGGPLFLAEL